ncbi:hypothetical protein SGQ44_17390 [Flavobacterium sp. Fl-77]|uniref:Uncharacterized protein n=1 Tax=Flavobacterium flavipigmentatum TaxID=2893884 RepID=A0AAJ2SHQ4_9FLAO|nr:MULTISPECIES: hypothetical protein [unclassified Flavobacterium]MDX6183982.1 hypothetical protein [Flavobacterium sp. Fl-33]MDX6187535.1 hypothetical protein [Flavobacterium sp. Fl-77]UFH38428.1 hypothetical protein LNP22_17075 [Flavobacterium sp. F-70]
MNINISVKQLGKKHPVLQEKSISLDTSDSVVSVRTFLELIVKHQVELFHASSFEWEDEDTIHLPKENYLPILTDTGKVGFGAVYNHNKVDIAKAQENAIVAFEDGLYALFQGDDQLESLNHEIDLSQNKSITFIRLTFLAGSYW